ncbi:asparaginase domain-containing protein [Aidingimonas halophila]|uniref:asparaginase n=1 Tax=Aidingimonas halophila TaxID=574349 RepID=A0A1H3FIJ2_9GAMM|nr:asparaginase domain-containing protein [Aidingimonas halophila]GHC37770.1 L-asparaginase 1 [Aidingimonas halophila]SDX90806.1 asparaginase [Aidingimonas halophila]
MSRLLILYTGGTLGMQPSSKGYVPSRRFAEQLDAALVAQPANRLPNHDLQTLHPLIDSADLAPVAWNRLVATLAEVWTSYDGFVILHGTDTLAYTASALSFLLGPLDKPVVLTGAQIPLGEPRSDALNNVVLAMQAAGHSRAPREVCIAFHDRLLRGNRARKCRTQGLDAFDSPNAPWLGEAGIALRLNGLPPLPVGTPDLTPADFEAGRTAVLHCHPGLSPRQVTRQLDDPQLQGLVLMTYGVGNPPGLDGQLLTCLRQATERGLAIVNVTQCGQGMVQQGTYATGRQLEDAGVIAGRDLTPEAAITKLDVLLARGQRGQALRDALSRPLRGEMCAH